MCVKELDREPIRFAAKSLTDRTMGLDPSRTCDLVIPGSGWTEKVFPCLRRKPGIGESERGDALHPSKRLFQCEHLTIDDRLC
jgi:hypothetical protein